MSEALTIPEAIGPGRLVLVVGPSGAGKDTLLDLAKTACTEDRNICFPRRVVTREASVSEDNEQLSPDAFREALATLSAAGLANSDTASDGSTLWWVPVTGDETAG